jgi:transcriptional regulator with XRE-family HTH domain
MGKLPDVEDAGIEDFYAHMGEKVRSARLAAGISQDVLAQRVGLTRSSIANLEAGRQRIALHLFIAICQALDKEVWELLPGKPEPHHSPISTDIEETLANSPESMQKFVHEAVARREIDSEARDNNG